MKSLPILFIIFLLSLNSAQAQEIVQEKIPCNKQRMNADCDKGWFTLGLGSDSDDLIHSYLRANFGRDFPYQITITGSSSLFGGRQSNYIGVSKGASIVDKVGRLSIFGGPVIAWGDDFNLNPGASINAQVNIAPFIPLGLGLDFYGIATPTYKMFGIGFSLVIEGHK